MNDISENLIALCPSSLNIECVTRVVLSAFESCDSLILSEARKIIEKKKKNQTLNSFGETSVECWNGSEYFRVQGKRPERGGSCAVVAIFLNQNILIFHIG